MKGRLIARAVFAAPVWIGVLMPGSVSCTSGPRDCHVVGVIRTEDGRVRVPCKVTAYREGTQPAASVNARTNDGFGLSVQTPGALPLSVAVEVSCHGYERLLRGPFTVTPGKLGCPDHDLGEFRVSAVRRPLAQSGS